MSRLVLGIDPGKDGAGVLLDGDVPILSWRTKELLVEGDYVPSRLLEQLQLACAVRPALAVLELPGLRPGESGTSARTIGRGWGLWEMALAALRVPLLVPAPARWTRVILRDAPGEGKARAVHVALRRCPGLDLTPGRARNPHTGLADACCLALYGQTQLATLP